MLLASIANRKSHLTTHSISIFDWNNKYLWLHVPIFFPHLFWYVGGFRTNTTSHNVYAIVLLCLVKDIRNLKFAMHLIGGLVTNRHFNQIPFFLSILFQPFGLVWFRFWFDICCSMQLMLLLVCCVAASIVADNYFVWMNKCIKEAQANAAFWHFVMETVQFGKSHPTL